VTDHLRSLAAYRRVKPDATARQWQNARNQANQRRRERGEAEIGAVAEPVVTFPDKKVGATDWREMSDWVTRGQELRHKGGWSQHHATIQVDTPHDSILLLPFSDAHIGSWGTSYAHLVAFTEEVLAHPQVYIGCVGDLVNLAIKLRGVLEVKDDVLPPEMQHNFFESWLNEIAPKILFAGWGNHDIQREEDGAGASIHKRMLERRVPYFGGIGHVDLHVGAATYRIATTHRFRGSTGINPLAGHKRYCRFEAQDRDIAIGGDLHRPCYESYYDGEKYRIALNCGALQTGSGYAHRFFSLYTIPEYPCVELFANEHRMIVYRSLSDWQATMNRNAA
jgi:hypothetical protein